MSDLVKWLPPLVERLRKAEIWETQTATHLNGNTSYRTDLGLEAADEIERLTARSEVAEARVEKLRHALLPFANIAADDGDDFSRYEKEAIVRYEASVGEISLARKALEESK